jgi:hypothetical protein
MSRTSINPSYATCPYSAVPPSSLWSETVAGRGDAELNPHVPARLRLRPETRVGTAGSCFAQHISRSLVGAGFNYLVVEQAPTWLTPEECTEFNYGVFSARYGNIYTALQLLQLFEHAYDRFRPADSVWRSDDGRFFDLLRPRIQPNGFASEDELLRDRAQHLQAVRRLFETVDVFVFTLGLTESWRAKADGTVYPICPGCGVGRFDPARYEFHNFGVGEVIEHMGAFVAGLRRVNPSAQLLLTVSPVPLAATMEPRHVVQSTVYSKSVLRVAAEELVRCHEHVHYFGSYEIITATYRNHLYFSADRRSVTPAGVAHVMDVFFKQFADGVPVRTDAPLPAPAPTDPTGGTAAQTPAPTDAAQDAPPGTPPGVIVCDEYAMYAALASRRNEAA